MTEPQQKGTWTTIFLVYAIFVLLRFLQALFLSEPVVIPDELVYKSMAYSFFKWQNFFSLSAEAVGAPTNVGYVLYQLPLSLSFFFNDNFLIAGKLINALLINATVFPLYLLLKDFVPKREAAAGAALALLLPTFGYASFLMAENLYLPLFSLVLFLAYKSFQTGLVRDAVFTAVCLLLLFMTKPHALSLLVAIGVCGVFLAVTFHFKKWEGSISRTIFRSLVVIGLIIATGLLVSQVIYEGSFSRVVDFILAVTKGIPTAVVSGIRSEGVVVTEFLSMVSAHIGSVFFLFLTPLLLTLWGWRDSLRKREVKSLVFSSFILCLVLELLALSWFISLFLAPEEAFFRLHGRFYSMLFPLLVISFFVFRKKLIWSRFRKTVFLVSSAATFLAFLPSFTLYFRSPEKFTLAIDYPELAWAAFLPGSILIIMILLFGATTILTMAKKKADTYLIFFLIFALVSNIAESWVLARYYQPPRAATRPARMFISNLIRDPDARVAVFDNGEIFRTQTAFWLPYRFTRAVTLPEHSRLKSADIPEDTDFVILFGIFSIDFTPVRGYHSGNCRILRLSERENVIREFRGVYPDSPDWIWTKQEFAYFPTERFVRLVITLNERKSYFPNTLSIKTDHGQETIQLDREQSSIVLPYSHVYVFTLDKTFNPRKMGINRDDDRDLGIALRSAFMEFRE